MSTRWVGDQEQQTTCHCSLWTPPFPRKYVIETALVSYFKTDLTASYFLFLLRCQNCQTIVIALLEFQTMTIKSTKMMLIRHHSKLSFNWDFKKPSNIMFAFLLYFQLCSEWPRFWFSYSGNTFTVPTSPYEFPNNQGTTQN